jgi:hypothetical protein
MIKLTVNKPAIGQKFQFNKLTRQGSTLAIPINQLAGKARKCPVRAQMSIGSNARTYAEKHDFKIFTTQADSKTVLVVRCS